MLISYLIKYRGTRDPRLILVLVELGTLYNTTRIKAASKAYISRILNGVYLLIPNKDSTLLLL